MLLAFDDFNSLITSILWNIDSKDKIIIIVPSKMNVDTMVAAVTKSASIDVTVSNKDHGIRLINNVWIIPCSVDGSMIRGLKPKSIWVYNRDHMKEEDWTVACYGFTAVAKDPIKKVKRNYKGPPKDKGKPTKMPPEPPERKSK